MTLMNIIYYLISIRDSVIVEKGEMGYNKDIKIMVTPPQILSLVGRFMKKKFEKNFEYLKYSKSDIIKIADYIFNLYDNVGSDHKTFKTVIDCEDNQTLEIEGEALSSNQEVLDDKKIYKIYISYIHYRNNRRIDIFIKEGDYKAKVYIEGDDKEWVDSTSVGINEIFNSITPQNTIYKKYKWFIFNIPAILIGGVIVYFFVKLLHELGYYKVNNLPEIETSPLMYLVDKLIDLFPPTIIFIAIGGSWIIGMCLISLFSFRLDQYFKNIWPKTELCFGPKHKQYAHNQRKIWPVIITVVGIVWTIIGCIQVLYDIL